jgi:hypothetical protein
MLTVHKDEAGGSTDNKSPTRAFARIFKIVVVVALGIVAIIYWLGATDTTVTPQLPLKVSKTTALITDVLQITNVGNKEIEIADITINERDECTQFRGNIRVGQCGVDMASLSPSVRHTIWVKRPEELHNPIDASEVPNGEYAVTKLCSTYETYQGLGRPGWVTTPAPARLNIAIPKISLKIGETRSWANTCQSSIVRTTIQTDQGIESYRWE